MPVKRLAPHTFGAEIPGGHYTAIQGEKFWAIKDVPIFCAVPKGERGNKKDIGAEWMDGALAKAKAREEGDRYLPPLHFHHHSWGDEAKAAGFFKLTRRGQVVYEGKEVDALFADLLVPVDKFSMIENFQFPYRSVEVFEWDVPEVNSLALLDHEVPFFRLELLTIGERVTDQKSKELAVEYMQHSPATSRVCVNPGGVLTFSFKQTVAKLAVAPAPDPTKKKDPAADMPADGEGDEEADVAGGDEDDAKTIPCEACKGEGIGADEKFCPQCKGTGETDAATNKPADGETPADMGEADMKTLLQTLVTQNQQILAHLGTLAKAPVADPASPPAEPPDPDPNGAKMSADTKAALKEMAAASAEATAARKEIQTFRLENKVASLVKAKLDGELKGKNLDADDVKKLEKFAKLGEEYLNEFSAVLAKRLPDDPHGIDEEVPGTPAAAELANVDCLKKYAHDPALFAEAQGYYKEWQAMSAKGFDKTAEKHIDVQMRYHHKEIGAGRNF